VHRNLALGLDGGKGGGVDVLDLDGEHVDLGGELADRRAVRQPTRHRRAAHLACGRETREGVGGGPRQGLGGGNAVAATARKAGRRSAGRACATGDSGRGRAASTGRRREPSRVEAGELDAEAVGGERHHLAELAAAHHAHADGGGRERGLRGGRAHRQR